MLRFNKKNKSPDLTRIKGIYSHYVSEKANENISHNLDKKTSNNVSNSAEDKASDAANEYVKKVCDQIRWKRAHNSVSEELLEHIEDQKYAFIKKGQNKEDAEKNAILEMGDAVTVGQQLDRTHRPKPDWGIFSLIGILIFFGAIVQFIISYHSGITSEIAYFNAFSKYLITIPFGIAILLFIYLADYTLIARKPIVSYGIIFLLVVNESISRYTNYSNLLYKAILLIPLYAAIVYSYRGGKYKEIIKLGIIAIVTISIFIYGHGYMPCLIFSFSGIVVLTAAIVKNWFLVNKVKALSLVYIPTIVAMNFLLLSKQAYISLSGRGIFLLGHRGIVEDGYNYILVIIKNYLDNSRFYGKGINFYLQNSDISVHSSIQDMLPSWWADYSLTYIIYRFGYVWAILLISVILVLLIKMLVSTFKQTSEFGFIICLSTTMAFVFQYLCYILSNFGLMTAVPGALPFITYGQKSFIVNMFLMGLFLSANRNKAIVNDIKASRLKEELFGNEKTFIGKCKFTIKRFIG